jgi:hypothetical protein
MVTWSLDYPDTLSPEESRVAAQREIRRAEAVERRRMQQLDAAQRRAEAERARQRQQANQRRIAQAQRLERERQGDRPLSAMTNREGRLLRESIWRTR